MAIDKNTQIFQDKHNPLTPGLGIQWGLPAQQSWSGSGITVESDCPAILTDLLAYLGQPVSSPAAWTDTVRVCVCVCVCVNTHGFENCQKAYL